ncbi:MOSC domain-containing protein [Pedobacter petrophilus]|uniref:MOSC domain-containing protein n=1 Tax=Pedobacter petrophilus TaxID=1908241 RepID=A0A7K0G300_9SPHI|nr:MOSC N-terminal beta barrel domain-containing protein [Pedobacter petrophilus]MRX77780.1 MOSC domain-containing protein [Pedobacter petrophilus]
MNAFHLTDIYIYPIKSLGGIRLEEAMLEEKGLQYDRRWMLVDQEGTFITQRKHHQLSLLQVRIEEDHLSVGHKEDEELKISFKLAENTGESIEVTVWDDTSVGSEVSKTVSHWFSDYLQFDVKLVRMSDEEKIYVDPRYAANGEIKSFSDGYPCLIIGQSSLDGLNEKLDEPVQMNRFRPNFVFSGGEAHVEDRFKNFRLGNVLFSAVKPCARCVLITIDQETGIKGLEPLRTLATYRTQNKKIMFGQNLLHVGAGLIKVGDEMNIQDWKSIG